MYHNIPPDPTPETQSEQNEQAIVEEAYEIAAELLERGISRSAVRKELRQAGYSSEVVSYVMSSFTEEQPGTNKRRRKRNSASRDDEPTAADLQRLHAQQVQALREVGQRNMLIGGLVCGAGVAITLFTLMAAEGGGTFILAWGAILFGGIQFVWGMSQASAQ